MPNYARGSAKDIPSPPEASDPAVPPILDSYRSRSWSPSLERCVAPAGQTPRTACGQQWVWRGGAVKLGSAVAETEL
jgi:hypothetical protein